MNHWLRIIVLMLLMVLKGTVAINASCIEIDDNINDTTFVCDHQQKSPATVSDFSQIYRICSSRPERVMPSYGYTKHEQKQSRRLQLVHYKNAIVRYGRQRNHIRISRMMHQPACEYYVFTLRKLLC